MRYIVLATLLFFVGVGLTQIERHEVSFTPLVRLRTTDGMFVTVIQPPSTKRATCSDAINRFIDHLGRSCAVCFVESSECATELKGLDRALAMDESLPLYRVSGQGLRIGILGPPSAVRAQCEVMASQMAKLGVRDAACTAPSKPQEKPQPS